jgi:hypothetical protein
MYEKVVVHRDHFVNLPAVVGLQRFPCIQGKEPIPEPTKFSLLLYLWASSSIQRSRFHDSGGLADTRSFPSTLGTDVQPLAFS